MGNEMESRIPFLSIIVPAYNIETYLDQCVNSILSQTFSDFELILVDDGSGDNTGKYCDNYEKLDSRVKVLHQKNGGLVNARKAGLLLARGKYACYVDGDDWVLPDMYEKLCGYAMEYDADLVIGDFLSVKDGEEQNCQDAQLDKGNLSGEGVEKITNPFSAGFYNKEDLTRNIYPRMLCDGRYFKPGFRAAIWSKIYKRELLLSEQMEVSDEIRMGEDTAVVFTALLHAKSMYYAKECYGYCYRVRNDSMSHALTKPFYAKEVLVLGEHLKKRFALYPQFQDILDTQRLYYGVFMVDMLLSPHATLKELLFDKKLAGQLKEYAESLVGAETLMFAKTHTTSSKMRRMMAYVENRNFVRKLNLWAFVIYEKLRG